MASCGNHTARSQEYKVAGYLVVTLVCLKCGKFTESIIKPGKKIHVKVFWVVKPCSGGVGYQCFGGPCCIHLQGEVKTGSKVPNCNTTWHHNPEDSDLNLYCCKNLKSHIRNENHIILMLSETWHVNYQKNRYFTYLNLEMAKGNNF
jgi:hypothetical protein